MVKCPNCTKTQLVFVQGPARTSCYYCGARWVQSGVEQDDIIGLGSPESALRSMRQAQPTTEDST